MDIKSSDKAREMSAEVKRGFKVDILMFDSVSEFYDSVLAF